MADIKKQEDKAKSLESVAENTEKAGIPLADEQLDKVAGAGDGEEILIPKEPLRMDIPKVIAPRLEAGEVRPM